LDFLQREADETWSLNYLHPQLVALFERQRPGGHARARVFLEESVAKFRTAKNAKLLARYSAALAYFEANPLSPRPPTSG
jgi:hypothetical protein